MRLAYKAVNIQGIPTCTWETKRTHGGDKEDTMMTEEPQSLNINRIDTGWTNRQDQNRDRIGTNL